MKRMPSAFSRLRISVVAVSIFCVSALIRSKRHRGAEQAEHSRQHDDDGDQDQEDDDRMGNHVPHSFDAVEKSLHGGLWRGHRIPPLSERVRAGARLRLRDPNRHPASSDANLPQSRNRSSAQNPKRYATCPKLDLAKPALPGRRRDAREDGGRGLSGRRGFNNVMSRPVRSRPDFEEAGMGGLRHGHAPLAPLSVAGSCSLALEKT